MDNDAVTAAAERLTHYIRALEDVVFGAYTEAPGDTPSEMIGLAAATLEQLHAEWLIAIPVRTPVQQNGLDSFAMLANRLRITEARIAAIYGEHVPPVQLPAIVE